MYTGYPYNPNDGGVVYYGFFSANQQKIWNFIHSYQDNSFTKATTGISMVYYKSNFGGNTVEIDGLVGVYAQPSGNKIRFLPYASGIYDFELHDQNDWVYINEYVCKSIRGFFGDANSYCKTIVGLPVPPPPLFSPSSGR